MEALFYEIEPLLLTAYNKCFDFLGFWYVPIRAQSLYIFQHFYTCVCFFIPHHHNYVNVRFVEFISSKEQVSLMGPKEHDFPLSSMSEIEIIM